MSLTDLLFSFQGRIGRGPFWLGTFLAWVYYLLAFTTYNLLGGFNIGFLHPMAMAGQSAAQETLALAIFVFSVAMIVWVDLALQIKRWHDRGKSGWWVLICLVPVVGLLWAIVECGAFPGTPEENDFEMVDGDPVGATALAA